MASNRRRQDRVESERQRIVGARRFWASKEDAGKEGDSVWASIYCTIRDRRRCKSHSSLPRAASWGARTPSTLSDGSDVSELATSTPRGFRTTTTTTSTTRRPLRSKSMDALTVKQEEPVDAEVEVTSARTYQTTCHLVLKPVPVHFSSSVHVDLTSTRRTFVEEVTFKMRLVPLRFSETLSLRHPAVPTPQPGSRDGTDASRERFV